MRLPSVVSLPLRRSRRFGAYVFEQPGGLEVLACATFWRHGDGGGDVFERGVYFFFGGWRSIGFMADEEVVVVSGRRFSRLRLGY